MRVDNEIFKFSDGRFQMIQKTSFTSGITVFKNVAGRLQKVA